MKSWLHIIGLALLLGQSVVSAQEKMPPTGTRTESNTANVVYWFWKPSEPPVPEERSAMPSYDKEGLYGHIKWQPGYWKADAEEAEWPLIKWTWIKGHWCKAVRLPHEPGGDMIYNDEIITYAWVGGKWEYLSRRHEVKYKQR